MTEEFIRETWRLAADLAWQSEQLGEAEGKRLCTRTLEGRYTAAMLARRALRAHLLTVMPEGFAFYRGPSK